MRFGYRDWFVLVCGSALGSALTGTLVFMSLEQWQYERALVVASSMRACTAPQMCVSELERTIEELIGCKANVRHKMVMR